MGSTGTSRFTDYSKEKPNGSKPHDGENEEDKCSKAFTTSLEEVPRCSYYKRYDALPELGTHVELVFNTRLSIITTDGDEIGYLPTKYNYLKYCMDNGYSYIGIVSSTILDPIPAVNVDITPV